MKLYKLKRLEGDGLFYTLDMIINERLFLATRKSTNDINEGLWDNQFEITGKENQRQLGAVTKFKSFIDSQRFTCFIEKIENNLMWAHYAGGFSGIALEYELDETKFDIRKVDYNGRPKITIDQVKDVLSGESLPQDIGVLKQKEKCWIYENEWRLYGNNNEQYIKNIKPTGIILGARETKHAQLLEKLMKKLSMNVKYMAQELILTSL